MQWFVRAKQALLAFGLEVVCRASLRSQGAACVMNRHGYWRRRVGVGIFWLVLNRSCFNETVRQRGILRKMLGARCCDPGELRAQVQEQSSVEVIDN